MQGKTAEEILAKEFTVAIDSSLSYRPFVPTADGEIIPLKPSQLLTRMIDKFANFSILLGTNSHEGSKTAMDFLPMKMTQKGQISSKEFDDSINSLLSDQPQIVIENVKFQYTNWTIGAQDPEENFRQILKLFGDYQYQCPVQLLSQILAQATKVYKYSFEVRNPLSSWPAWSGIKHGDELDYLFGRPLLTNSKLFSNEHKQISIFMIEAWSNFSKYGNPNGASRALHEIGWPQFRPSSKHILQISTFKDQGIDYIANDDTIFTAITVEDNEKDCAFWNTLVPKLRNLHEQECKMTDPHFSSNFLPLTGRDIENKLATSATTTCPTTTTTATTTISTTTTTTQRATATTTDSSTSPLTTTTSTMTTKPSSKAPLLKEAQSKFLANFTQKVKFRMSVNQPPQPKDWKFYNAPGNDAIMLSKTSSTSSTRKTTATTTATTPTMTTSTQMALRKPTYRPQAYDPFSRFPYYRMDVEDFEEPKVEKDKESMSEIRENERSRLYFPLFEPSNKR